MAAVILCSHDGFGVGHVRRHVVLARALRQLSSSAHITLVTGLPFTPPWLAGLDADVVSMPALIKDATGTYRSPAGDAATTLSAREMLFMQTVERVRPDVVIVDRHPFGISGELTIGIKSAKAMGASCFVGLRDILDDPSTVRAELAGSRWHGASELFDAALVYGTPQFCDHATEYGIPLELRYCGWAVEIEPSQPPIDKWLVVSAGGGGDGVDVLRLAVRVAERLADWRVTIAAGGYVDMTWLSRVVAESSASARVSTLQRAPGCAALFASAAATLQMAGYNTTFESIGAGRRPILVPRQVQRAEQTIRSDRLRTRDLADVVNGSAIDEVCELLQSPRLLSPDAATRAGIDCRGAVRAAEILLDPDAQSRSLPSLAHDAAR